MSPWSLVGQAALAAGKIHRSVSHPAARSRCTSIGMTRSHATAKHPKSAQDTHSQQAWPKPYKPKMRVGISSWHFLFFILLPFLSALVLHLLLYSLSQGGNIWGTIVWYETPPKNHQKKEIWRRIAKRFIGFRGKKTQSLSKFPC